MDNCGDPLYPLPAHPPLGPQGPAGPPGPEGPIGPPGPALHVVVVQDYSELEQASANGTVDADTLYVTADDGMGYVWLPDGTLPTLQNTPGGFPGSGVPI